MAVASNRSETDPYKLISQSEQYDYGTPQRSDLLERAVAAADCLGNVRAQFDARKKRLSAAMFSGEVERMLALFAWCQRMVDDRPDIINPAELLWSFKYALTNLPSFARITQAQIETVANEMEKRYAAMGASLRPVYHKRSETAAYQGKVEQARALLDEAIRHPRDHFADCSACELSYSLYLLALEHRFDELLKVASPVIAGAMHCTEVPHASWPRIMLALFALGQKHEVRRLLPESYRLIRSNPLFIEEVALHIEFLVTEQDLEQAAELALRHLSWLRAITNDKKQFHYIRALHCLLSALVEAPIGASTWQQQLIDGLEGAYGPPAQEAFLADRVELLSRRVAKAGLALATALDQRNANTFFTMQWHADAFVIA